MNSVLLPTNVLGRDLEFAKNAGAEYANKWLSGGHTALSQEKVLAIAPFEIPIHGLDRKNRFLVQAFCESAMNAFGEKFELDAFALKVTPRFAIGHRERQAQLDAEHLEAVRVQDILCDRLDPQKRRAKRNMASETRARAERDAVAARNYTGFLFPVSLYASQE